MTVLFFEIRKQLIFSQLNFEQLLVTDSNDFSQISLVYLLISINADTRNFSKKISAKCFTRRDLL